MSRKIDCLRGIPHHGNVVKFIGEVDNSGDEGFTNFRLFVFGIRDSVSVYTGDNVETFFCQCFLSSCLAVV